MRLGVYFPVGQLLMIRKIPDEIHSGSILSEKFKAPFRLGTSWFCHRFQKPKMQIHKISYSLQKRRKSAEANLPKYPAASPCVGLFGN
jgi:hypothetical protein